MEPVDPREELWTQQREDRGFDDRELWSLDYTIAKFVLPRLKAYREEAWGWPTGLNMELWKEILNKMIWSFQCFVDDTHPRHLKGEQREQWYRDYYEGFDLFGKYFCELWY